MQNQAFYRTGIFGNFFFGGGNFAFSKREFPVALVATGLVFASWQLGFCYVMLRYVITDANVTHTVDAKSLSETVLI